MKKVIHVITRMDMGGSAQNTLLTCLGIDKRKYQVILVIGSSVESIMTDREQGIVSRQLRLASEAGVRIIIMESLLRRIDPLKDLSAFYFLYRLFKREKPDIVHTHTSKAGIVGRWAAWLARVPVIVHTPHGHVFFGHFKELLSKTFYYVEKFSEPITDCLIALTEGEKKDYFNLNLVSKDKVATIHSGVDTCRFSEIMTDLKETRKRLGLPMDKPVVGFIGWLLPIKGPTLLLEAMKEVWRKYPDAQLVYIGKGEQEAELRLNAQQTGAGSNIHFLGWREDVPELVHMLDILVLPSFNEGMGRVIIEAMAASKPVIGSNVGGIPDLIEHEVNGLLFPVGNTAALSGSILRLLADDEGRRKMGSMGKLKAGQYDLSDMIDKIEKLYSGLKAKRSNL